MAITRRGLMLVISSPSGAGKSTLCRGLLNTHENLEMSISATTRQPRPSERNGVDYHFLSRDDFIERRDKGEFLEWAKVFDNLYGTLRQPVDRALDAGRDVLFDVDWQGAQQLDQAAGEDVVRVFIMPPSKQELERRLRARAEDDAAEVARRMAQFHDEVSRWDAYDYVLINDDLDRAQANLNAILKAERLKRERQVGLSEFVKSLEQEPAATG